MTSSQLAALIETTRLWGWPAGCCPGWIGVGSTALQLTPA